MIECVRTGADTDLNDKQRGAFVRASSEVLSLYSAPEVLLLHAKDPFTLKVSGYKAMRRRGMHSRSGWFWSLSSHSKAPLKCAAPARL